LADNKEAVQHPVREVALGASYDDGATWCETKVRHVGDHWAEIPPGGVAGGFVSLHASATGTDGNKFRTLVRPFVRLARFGLTATPHPVIRQTRVRVRY
jgi:hypothetical protein